MKEELKVSLVQFDMKWDDSKANLAFLDKLLDGYESDLIVLPEMFNTGFSMNAEKIAEEPMGETYQWMKEKAEKGNYAITGSVSTKENGQYFNRMYFVTPDNTVWYDKKHLFGYGQETGKYSPGNEIVNAEYQGWKFRLIVCYDLRFPAWCRNTDDYEVMLCPASWPRVRNLQWQSLLRARAIENMAYVIGVNRIGTDGYDLEYIGNSRVFDAIGSEIPIEFAKEFLLETVITKESLKGYRDRYGFLNDRDEFELV